LIRWTLVLLWTRQAPSWHIWFKIMKDMIHQLTILTAHNILTSFYYSNNQNSSLITFHKFISCLIKTQFFTPGSPGIEKKFLSFFYLMSVQFTRVQCADYKYHLIFKTLSGNKENVKYFLRALKTSFGLKVYQNPS